MARHLVRRLPVVENPRLSDIVAQATCLKEGEKKTGELVERSPNRQRGSAGSDARYSERVRCRLPLLEAAGDELRGLLRAPVLQHLEV